MALRLELVLTAALENKKPLLPFRYECDFGYGCGDVYGSDDILHFETVMGVGCGRCDEDVKGFGWGDSVIFSSGLSDGYGYSWGDGHGSGGWNETGEDC